jgi:predicted RNase H-like HicB family nuclease
VQLTTVVEDDLTAALRRAEVEQTEDGTFVAWVSGLPGIIAGGADVHECARELYRRLEEWVMASLARGQKLPVLDGIDLNSDASRTLGTYHQGRLESARAAGRKVSEDEEQLEAAFEELDRSI